MRCQVTMWALVLALVTYNSVLAGESAYGESSNQSFVHAFTQLAAGTRTVAAWGTGGSLIVFPALRPRTTTAANRFPGFAGRTTLHTTAGGRRRSIISTARSRNCNR